MHVGIVSLFSILPFLRHLDEIPPEVEGIKYFNAPSVENLVVGLLHAGVVVSVFSYAKGIKKPCIVKGGLLTIHYVPFPHIPGIRFMSPLILPFTVRRYILRHSEGIDIFHFHWTHHIALPLNVPQVLTVRDWAPYILKMQSLLQPEKVLQRVMFLLVDSYCFRCGKFHIVANSGYIKDLIKTRWKKEVVVIPNSVRQEFIIKDRMVFPQSFDMVSISAANDKRKNICTLLKAFQYFNKHHGDNCRLYLIGKPFAKGEIFISEWEAMGLLKRVVLVGEVEHEQVIDYLDRMSLMIHPSYEESFGNTLIEAMARRVPVIGGLNSGAVPCVLNYGKAGILCDVSNYRDIADSMEKVYSDIDYRNKIVSNATDYLENHYSENIVIQQTIGLYRELIYEVNQSGL